jgi:short-subunit dehydrogenase
MTLKTTKVAWITGGGTGIGKELTLILAEKNYDVIISGRRKEKLIETARVNKKKIHPIPLDVKNPIQCKKVSETIYKKFKKIDLLILNAAIYSPGSMTKICTTEAKKVIDINLLGVLNCLSPVAKIMQENKEGHIVFVSSPAGYQGLPGGGFYGVTKSALTFLAETLNIELHKSNIKVQVVNPGFVKTPMTDKNSFFMPFLMTPNNAAKKIFEKLESSEFEIFFPKKLIIPMKLLRLLPYSIYFFLIKKLIKLP